MLRLSHQHLRPESRERAIEPSEPHRSPQTRSGAGRTSPSMPARDNITLLTSSAARRHASMPLLQHNLGVALRRTRRVDGVEVDRSLPRDAVLALRNATTPTAPVRGRLGTARGPRGCPRRPGARRWRTGVGWRPTATQYRRRPLSGAVLEVSPVLSEPDPVAVQNGSESENKPPTAIILGNDAFE